MKFTFKSSAVVFGAAVLFFLDRFAKYYFLARPDLQLDLIGPWFGLGLAVNRGVAFGLPFLYWPLIVLSAIIILILIYWVIKEIENKDLRLFASLTMIMVGASSNFIDRIKFGLVVDYFDLRYFSIFNLADVAITFGVAYLLLILLTDKERHQIKN